MSKAKILGIFKNPDGHIVIWQTPNVPLIGWAIARGFALLMHEGAVKTGFSHLATALIFTWAYLELRSGESPFRRILGLVILVLTVISFFKLSM